MNFLKSLLFQRSRRILLLGFVLLATAGAFYQDAPFYLVNKNGTLVIQARYTIDGASLTNTSISLPATLAGTGLQINGATILTSQTGTGTSIVTNTGPSISAPVLTGTSVLGRTRISGGTALVIGDFVPSAAWGTGPTIAVGGTSTDASGTVSVTAGTTPAANPQLTLTFHDGAWPAIPACFVNRTEGAAPAGSVMAMFSPSTTSVIITMFGTPVAATTYTFQWHCESRSA